MEEIGIAIADMLVAAGAALLGRLTYGGAEGSRSLRLPGPNDRKWTKGSIVERVIVILLVIQVVGSLAGLLVAALAYGDILGSRASHQGRAGGAERHPGLSRCGACQRSATAAGKAYRARPPGMAERGLHQGSRRGRGPGGGLTFPRRESRAPMRCHAYRHPSTHAARRHRGGPTSRRSLFLRRRLAFAGPSGHRRIDRPGAGGGFRRRWAEVEPRQAAGIGVAPGADRFRMRSPGVDGPLLRQL